MPNCSGYFMRGYKQHFCSRKGPIERDGVFYCKQHDPLAVKARDEAYAALAEARLADRPEVRLREANKRIAELEEKIKEMLSNV